MATTYHPLPGDVLRYHDPGEGVQHGEHVETVAFVAPRHVHTRHLWPDGVVTLGRFWLNEWRRRCRRGALATVAASRGLGVVVT